LGSEGINTEKPWTKRKEKECVCRGWYINELKWKNKNQKKNNAQSGGERVRKKGGFTTKLYKHPGRNVKKILKRGLPLGASETIAGVGKPRTESKRRICGGI